MFSQRKQGVVPDVFAVHANGSVGQVIKARNQAYQGALTCSRGPYDCKLLARSNRKLNVTEHGSPRLVLKPNTPEFYAALKPWSWASPFAVSQLTANVHHFGNGLHTDTCPIEQKGKARQRLQG